MDYLRLPFFAELDRASAVLLAGAGGGFDVFSGLPLYFGLRQAGKQVHLANLSFSHLEGASAPSPSSGRCRRCAATRRPPRRSSRPCPPTRASCPPRSCRPW